MKQYSVVTYLEDEVKAAVKKLQTDLFAMTGSRQCLDSWEPHVTVGDGIEVSEDVLEEVEECIDDLVLKQKIFTISLSGFGGKTDRVGGEGEVTTPYVLWVDVVVNEDLAALVRKVRDDVTSKVDLWYQMPQPYTPHVTVAFRDLSESGYQKGLEYLSEQSFSGVVEMSHIALVEKLPDSDKEYKRFYFKG